MASVEFGLPVRARQRTLVTNEDDIILGVGVGGTVFCLMRLGAGRGQKGQLTAARLSAITAAGCLTTATNRRQNSYTTSGDTTETRSPDNSNKT